MQMSLAISIPFKVKLMKAEQERRKKQQGALRGFSRAARGVATEAGGIIN